MSDRIEFQELDLPKIPDDISGTERVAIDALGGQMKLWQAKIEGMHVPLGVAQDISIMRTNEDVIEHRRTLEKLQARQASAWERIATALENIASKT